MIGKNKQISRIVESFLEKGIKLTHQRKVIAQVITDASDHPDANEIHIEAAEIETIGHLSLPNNLPLLLTGSSPLKGYTRKCRAI